VTARQWHLTAATLALTAGLACSCSEQRDVAEPSGVDPIAVIEMWNTARNRGDVDGAIALLADDALVLGFHLDDPDDRAELTEVFASQTAAGFHLTDRSCIATGTFVTCDYEMHDQVLDHWNLSLRGVHRYEVVDGLISTATRDHDRTTSDRVYGQLDAFRHWVTETHPDLAEVIWSTPGAAAYTTVVGAETMLSLLDDYQPPATRAES
jgi:hypothetical protein